MALNKVGNNTTGGAKTSFALNANNMVLQNTDDLKKVVGNSNVAASRQLKESLGLGDYSESAQLYREQAASAAQKIGIFPGFEAKKGTTLNEFKSIKKEMAGYRPNDFARQYSLSSINATLADFEKDQFSYWQEQDKFISINSELLLTRELESHYKTLIAMEDEYKSLVESGKQIESFKVKGDISRFKQQIDALKVQLVKDLT